LYTCYLSELMQLRDDTQTYTNTIIYYIDPSTKIIPKATANNPQVASGSQTGYPISNYTQAADEKKVG